MKHPNGLTDGQIEAERIARRISKERHGVESLWELYLMEAYNQVFVPQKEESLNE